MVTPCCAGTPFHVLDTPTVSAVQRLAGKRASLLKALFKHAGQSSAAMRLLRRAPEGQGRNKEPLKVAGLPAVMSSAAGAAIRPAHAHPGLPTRKPFQRL